MPRPLPAGQTGAHYAYRVHWDRKRKTWVGGVLEFPHLTTTVEYADPVPALEGIIRVTAEHVRSLAMAGTPKPLGFMDTEYTGRPGWRLTPEMHRDLAVEAAERGLSLAAYTNEVLAARHTTRNLYA